MDPITTALLEEAMVSVAYNANDNLFLERKALLEVGPMTVQNLRKLLRELQ